MIKLGNNSLYKINLPSERVCITFGSTKLMFPEGSNAIYK